MDFIKDGNRFYMGADKASPLAEITFAPVGNHSLVVDHTFTDPSMRGQGIARKLVERVASDSMRGILPGREDVIGLLQVLPTSPEAAFLGRTPRRLSNDPCGYRSLYSL